MRKWFWVLLLPLLLGFSVQHWHMKITKSRVAAPAGDCATTTCLAVMDFEGSACADGDALGEGERTCTATGTAEPDCTSATSPCPLEQANSGRLPASGDTIYNVSLGARTSGVDTLDFIFHIEATTTATRDLICLASSSSDCDCSARIDISSANVFADANNGPNSGIISLTVSTTYYGRLNYDITNDDCTLYVWTDDWGGSAATGSPKTSNGDTAGSVTGYLVQRSGANPNFVVDDIAMCDDNLTTESTHCTD